MDNCAVSQLKLGVEAELLSFNYNEHLCGI
jgi:hypothetical protein